jgi:MSHA pilin protein MshC
MMTLAHSVHPRKQPGFTMVELITVLIVVGIMATVALPRFNSAGFNTTGYRDKARAALEFARKSAVAQRRIVCVALAGSSLTLTIDNVTPETAGAGACPRLLTLPATDGACGGPTNAICAPNGIALAGPAGLTFDALGRPSAAAAYAVTDGAMNLPITVEAETGYVR